jgi:light-harvesting protein B-800-850 beta chain
VVATRFLAGRPSITLVRVQHDKNFLQGEDVMADDKVGITGLTAEESEEIHRSLIQGTQIFGIIAALAHLLAYIYSPWLH